MGAKVVAMSDSNGCIYDKNGIDLDLIKQIKEVERARIKEYLRVSMPKRTVKKKCIAIKPYSHTIQFSGFNLKRLALFCRA